MRHFKSTGFYSGGSDEVLDLADEVGRIPGREPILKSAREENRDVIL
ncbi:MAG: hypothetical protein ACLR23_12905 [Clostridia bacterium]